MAVEAAGTGGGAPRTGRGACLGDAREDGFARDQRRVGQADAAQVALSAEQATGGAERVAAGARAERVQRARQRRVAWPRTVRREGRGSLDDGAQGALEA